MDSSQSGREVAEIEVENIMLQNAKAQLCDVPGKKKMLLLNTKFALALVSLEQFEIEDELDIENDGRLFSLPSSLPSTYALIFKNKLILVRVTANSTLEPYSAMPFHTFSNVQGVKEVFLMHDMGAFACLIETQSFKTQSYNTQVQVFQEKRGQISKSHLMILKQFLCVDSICKLPHSGLYLLDSSSVVCHICKLTCTPSPDNKDNFPYYFKKLRTISLHPKDYKVLALGSSAFRSGKSFLWGGLKKEGLLDWKRNAVVCDKGPVTSNGPIESLFLNVRKLEKCTNFSIEGWPMLVTLRSEKGKGVLEVFNIYTREKKLLSGKDFKYEKVVGMYCTSGPVGEQKLQIVLKKREGALLRIVEYDIL